MEQGTHEELLKKQGQYKKLIARQLNAGEIADYALLTAGEDGTPKSSPKLQNENHDLEKCPSDP